MRAIVAIAGGRPAAIVAVATVACASECEANAITFYCAEFGRIVNNRIGNISKLNSTFSHSSSVNERMCVIRLPIEFEKKTNYEIR